MFCSRFTMMQRGCSWSCPRIDRSRKSTFSPSGPLAADGDGERTGTVRIAQLKTAGRTNLKPVEYTFFCGTYPASCTKFHRDTAEHPEDKLVFTTLTLLTLGNTSMSRRRGAANAPHFFQAAQTQASARALSLQL